MTRTPPDGAPGNRPDGSPDEGLAHVRRSWLAKRVMETVDTAHAGGYTWDASEYVPVLMMVEGEPTFAFARQPPGS